MWGVCHDDGHFRHGEGGGKEYPNLRSWKEIRAVVVLKVKERPDRKSEAAHRTRLVELRPSTTGVEKKIARV